MLKEFDLSGRVAIVTGASDGIGAATAGLLSSRGADVVMVARKAEGLQARAESIAAQTGGRCIPLAADARDEEQVKQLVARVLAECGRIDILVNNVGGGGRPTKLAAMTLAGWDSGIRLNLSSAVLCSLAVAPHMLERKSGAIVNVSSLAGMHGTKGFAPYSSAKAAVQMFTTVAAAEWGRSGVRVNCVAPGMIATDKAIASMGGQTGIDKIAAGTFPIGRAGRPDEVAQAIAFLVSDAASYITGETLVVGGGPTIKGMSDD